MAAITVLGAGVCGLAAGMLLARDGHDVTVLERDSDPVPETHDASWEAWARRGVSQFRQPHYLQSRGAAVLEAELPDVASALAAAGAVRFDALSFMPPGITDRAPRAGDERFVTLTARRPVLEQVVARAAAEEPRLDVRRGVGVETLTTSRRNGTPHVTGARTDAGEELRADLVVDAMGRRSALGRWLADAGAPPIAEEAGDCGFIYYTRFFRARDGGGPPEYRAPLLTPLEAFSILTLPGDNDTWSVTIYVDAGDRPLKAMRHADRWSAVLGACPRHAHWLDGEQITDVLPMAGIVDRYRRLAPDGRPVATGVAAVADAWACTNPSAGRGVALGLMHAAALRDVAREHLDDPPAFAAAWDERTERELSPWYRTTVAEDRARLRMLGAARAGVRPEPPADPAIKIRALFPAAAMRDPDLFRAFIETRACLTPLPEVLARPDIPERILELAGEGAPPPPGPTRAQVLELLAA